MVLTNCQAGALEDNKQKFWELERRAVRAVSGRLPVCLLPSCPSCLFILCQGDFRIHLLLSCPSRCPFIWLPLWRTGEPAIENYAFSAHMVRIFSMQLYPRPMIFLSVSCPVPALAIWKVPYSLKWIWSPKPKPWLLLMSPRTFSGHLFNSTWAIIGTD